METKQQGRSRTEDELLEAMRAGRRYPVRGLSVVEMESLKRLQKRGLCRFVRPAAYIVPQPLTVVQ